MARSLNVSLIWQINYLLKIFNSKLNHLVTKYQALKISKDL